jgi:hypothetical protein
MYQIIAYLGASTSMSISIYSFAYKITHTADRNFLAICEKDCRNPDLYYRHDVCIDEQGRVITAEIKRKECNGFVFPNI